MAKCPFAKWQPITGPSGEYSGGPFKIVHHTTEGSTAKGAMQAFAKNRSDPHFTVDATHIYQHLDTSQFARALRNAAGGVQTNRDSAVQIELVGFAHLPKDPAALHNLARLCRWIEATHGIPNTWPAGAPRPAKNGKDPGGHNRDPAIWDAKGGHYGHCHVPENTHWDPAYSAAEVAFIRDARFSAAGKLISPVLPAMASVMSKGAGAGRPARTTMLDHGSNDVDDVPESAAPTRKAVAKVKPPSIARIFNARPDTLDFRDKMYTPTLIEVPTTVPIDSYLRHKIPVLDQGQEGACTGFGLATVANYLLARRVCVPDRNCVSPRMFYELARRYDEWPGEAYSGSSARGAMKGWNKHGVCAEEDWKYEVEEDQRDGFTHERMASAKRRPLGAYFRVNHLDLIAMHAAIAEVGVLYATANVHEGWQSVRKDGKITLSDKALGGHAFAIVAYDERGFWIQNSWGKSWGRNGLAHVTYDDWLKNGTDVWVARLGVPVVLSNPVSFATAHAAASGQSVAYTYADLRPHLVSIGNEGRLKPGGDYGTTERELATIFEEDIPRFMDANKRKSLLLFAHGGLVGEDAAVQRVAEYRTALLEAGVYPLALMWHTDYWSTVTNVLQDSVRRRRPEGILDRAKDFMLDRLDDALEPLARHLSGKMAWSEMKENALAASSKNGAVRIVMDHLLKLKAKYPDFELHIVAHSAGSIIQAPLVQLWTEEGEIKAGPMKGETGAGLRLATCTLWAPACTVKLFNETYRPAIESRAIADFSLFCLTDKAEQKDDCASIYNKSLLYLVSNAFEDEARIPGFRPGAPILGMEKTLLGDERLKTLFATSNAQLIISPNNDPAESTTAATARTHGDFDDDPATVRSTFKRILGANQTGKRRLDIMDTDLEFAASATHLTSIRRAIDEQTKKTYP
jgi:hypothetical protein